MIAKLKALFAVLKKGEELTNAEVWKNRQVAGNLLAGVLIALAGVSTAFGYDLGLTDAQLESAAYGVMSILGVVNAVITVATSKRVGFGAGK